MTVAARFRPPHTVCNVLGKRTAPRIPLRPRSVRAARAVASCRCAVAGGSAWWLAASRDRIAQGLRSNALLRPAPGGGRRALGHQSVASPAVCQMILRPVVAIFSLFDEPGERGNAIYRTLIVSRSSRSSAPQSTRFTLSRNTPACPRCSAGIGISGHAAQDSAPRVVDQVTACDCVRNCRPQRGPDRGG
jgi:hypothetical protein